jgi:hypothetical protein
MSRRNTSDDKHHRPPRIGRIRFRRRRCRQNGHDVVLNDLNPSDDIVKKSLDQMSKVIVVQETEEGFIVEFFAGDPPS